MQIQVTIYGLFDVREPEAIRYVGQTRSSLPARRKQAIWHATKGPKQHTPNATWIREELSAGEHLGIRELDVCAKEDAFTCESHWIDRLQTRKTGFNVSLGNSRRQSAATRELISNAAVRREADPARKAANSARVQELWSDDDFRERMTKFWSSAEGQEKLRRRSAAGRHQRWHVNRGITNPECLLCASGVQS